MTEEEKIRQAQQFIKSEIQKYYTRKIDAFTWEQSNRDVSTGMHRLIVYQGENQSIFMFTKHELIDDFGTANWEKRLRERLDLVFQELAD
ncbi:hypothetical protein ES705_39944 [subsurface metagenome]